MSLFDTKNQLLLSYLSYLSYYVVLKAHGMPIASHPVVERLIESRLLLQKIRPVEAMLKPQLDKLIQMARGGKQCRYTSRRTQCNREFLPSVWFPPSPHIHIYTYRQGYNVHYIYIHIYIYMYLYFCSLVFLGSGAASSTARAKPDAFAAVGESDEEGAEEPPALDEEDDSDDEALEGGSGHQKGPQAYKAPKMLAMEYTGDRVSLYGTCTSVQSSLDTAALHTIVRVCMMALP